MAAAAGYMRLPSATARRCWLAITQGELFVYLCIGIGFFVVIFISLWLAEEIFIFIHSG
jgi:hypothetical protein